MSLFLSFLTQSLGFFGPSTRTETRTETRTKTRIWALQYGHSIRALPRYSDLTQAFCYFQHSDSYARKMRVRHILWLTFFNG